MHSAESQTLLWFKAWCDLVCLAKPAVRALLLQCFALLWLLILSAAGYEWVFRARACEPLVRSTMRWAGVLHLQCEALRPLLSRLAVGFALPVRG